MEESEPGRGDEGELRQEIERLQEEERALQPVYAAADRASKDAFERLSGFFDLYGLNSDAAPREVVERLQNLGLSGDTRVPAEPAQQWQQLAKDIYPGLVESAHWSEAAWALTRAHGAGFNVEELGTGRLGPQRRLGQGAGGRTDVGGLRLRSGPGAWCRSRCGSAQPAAGAANSRDAGGDKGGRDSSSTVVQRADGSGLAGVSGRPRIVFDAGCQRAGASGPWWARLMPGSSRLGSVRAGLGVVASVGMVGSAAGQSA